MKIAKLWKSTVCATSALAMVMSITSIPVNAAPATSSVAVSTTLDGTTNSLAGISLSLDNYYAATTEEANLGDDEKAAQVAAEDQAQEATEEQQSEEKAVSKYENTGIATVDKYVNIRKEASTDSEVVGKLYKGGAVTILKTEGDWVEVESGSVKGFMNKQFLAIGEEADKVAEEYGRVYLVVKTETLRVREEKSTDSRTLTLLAEGELYDVKKYDDNWVKVIVDDDTVGFVAKEFVKIKVRFQKAVSIEEERAAAEKKAAQEAAIKAQQEEQARAAAAASAATSSSSSSKTSSSSTSSKKPASSSSSSSSKPSSSSSSSTSKSGSSVASYALNFVGNSYRWGGTSLTNGTDCSGFTMSVYRHFGISLPRTSSAQSGAGRSVSISSLQAGDLLFYGSGSSISHVAIYIGGGQIVHASNKKDGIKISSYKYKTPICARRVL